MTWLSTALFSQRIRDLHVSPLLHVLLQKSELAMGAGDGEVLGCNPMQRDIGGLGVLLEQKDFTTLARPARKIAAIDGIVDRAQIHVGEEGLIFAAVPLQDRGHPLAVRTFLFGDDLVRAARTEVKIKDCHHCEHGDHESAIRERATHHLSGKRVHLQDCHNYREIAYCAYVLYAGSEIPQFIFSE